jgi:O-antigen ligase
MLLLLILNTNQGLRERNLFASYAFLLIGWPQIAQIVIQFFNLRLNEFNFVAVRYLPALTLALIYFLKEHPTQVRKEALLFSTPAIIALVFGALDNQTVLYPIAWIAISLPFLFENKFMMTSDLIQGIYAKCVFGISITSIAVTILNPIDAISACRSDKCNILGFIFSPDGGQSNVLSLTFGLLVAFLDLKRNYPWILVNSICLITLANFTGGRTGTLAGMACFLSISIFKMTSKKAKKVHALYLTSAVIFSLTPLVFVYDPLSFTGRPILWAAAKHFILEAPFFGHGASFWIRLQATSELQANYSPHNIWLELLVSTGVVGTLSIVVAIYSTLRNMDPKIYPIATSMLVGIFVSGFSEAMIMPYRLIITPGFWIFYICLSSFTKNYSNANGVDHEIK